MFRIITIAMSVACAFFCRGFCDTISIFNGEFNESLMENIEKAVEEDELKGSFSSSSREAVEDFFQRLEERYLKKMDTPSDEYYFYYSLKGVLAAPKIVDHLGDFYLEAIKLRDRSFQSILDLCDGDRAGELSKKVREEINEISSKRGERDWEDAILLSFGKSSKIDIKEGELIEDLFLKTCVKSKMIDDFFDDLFDVDMERCYEISVRYEKIFVESFYRFFFEMLKKSNSVYLNEFYNKYHNMKSFDDFKKIHFKLPSVEKLIDSQSFSSDFERDLSYLYRQYLEDLSDMLSIYNLFP